MFCCYKRGGEKKEQKGIRLIKKLGWYDTVEATVFWQILWDGNNNLQLSYTCLMKNILEQTIQWGSGKIRIYVGKTSTIKLIVMAIVCIT